MLKIEAQPQEKRLLTLTVEVDEERVLRARRAAARRISQKANVPGFRRGKAPYEVILRQFGEGAVMEEALEDLGQQVYKEALEQADLDPIHAGSLEDVKLNPLVLTYTVPLRPVVELGDYRSIRKEWKPGEVSEEALNTQMEHLREHQAAIDPVERPAQLDDVVVVNVSAHLADEGLESADDSFLLDDQNVSLLLHSDADWPAPAFTPNFVGMSAGEEKAVDYTFADDYKNESLRGKAAHFHLSVLEVKSRVLPEWSDELAQAIGEFETLDELRARLREDLQKQADRQGENAYAREVLDEIVNRASVDYPDVMLAEELDGEVEDLDRRLREQGLTLADYYKIQHTDEEKLRAELEPRARERLTRSLVLSHIVEVEDLSVDDEQVEERIDRLMRTFAAEESRKTIGKVFASDVGRRSVAVDLLKDRALERIVAIAKGEAPPLAEDSEEAGRPADQQEPGQTDAGLGRVEENAHAVESAGATESTPALVEEAAPAE